MPSTLAVEKTLMVSEISVSYGEPEKRFSGSDEKMVPHTRQVSNDRLLLMGALTVARYRRVMTAKALHLPKCHVSNVFYAARAKQARPPR
jgi:hypothetical protein